jgi:hypothetical protein
LSINGGYVFWSNHNKWRIFLEDLTTIILY